MNVDWATLAGSGVPASLTGEAIDFLGAREADCGCCTVVDDVALRQLARCVEADLAASPAGENEPDGTAASCRPAPSGGAS